MYTFMANLKLPDNSHGKWIVGFYVLGVVAVAILVPAVLSYAMWQFFEVSGGFPK